MTTEGHSVHVESSPSLAMHPLDPLSPGSFNWDGGRVLPSYLKLCKMPGCGPRSFAQFCTEMADAGSGYLLPADVLTGPTSSSLTVPVVLCLSGL